MKYKLTIQADLESQLAPYLNATKWACARDEFQHEIRNISKYGSFQDKELSERESEIVDHLRARFFEAFEGLGD